MTTLQAVIVNFNSGRLTERALRSLLEERSEGIELTVAVVENASLDDSLEYLRAVVSLPEFSPWVTLIESEKNLGFGYGNNLAFEQTLASPGKIDYFLLLNPDAFLRKGALKELLAFADEHKKFGICGPRLESESGQVQRSAFRFPSLLGELEGSFRLGFLSRILSRWIVAPTPPSFSCETDWISGACMLIRVEVIRKLQGFDEGFFLYFEEVDLCQRARKEGWKIFYAPASHVVHLKGQSTGVTDEGVEKKRLPAHWFFSRRYYFTKTHGITYAALSELVWLTGYTLWLARMKVMRKKIEDPPHLFFDFLRASICFGRFLDGGKKIP